MRSLGARWCKIPKLTSSRKVTEESILIVQIFDQKKFKKKDQGFLGVINVRIASVMDLDLGGDGPFCPRHIYSPPMRLV